MNVTNPVQGLKAVQDFLFTGIETPADVREKLIELIDPTKQTSPVHAAYEAAELIYARRDELPPELLEIGAQLATMLAFHRLYGMAVDSRGDAMAATIRAMPSVASEPPPAEQLEAPEPKAEYMPEPEVVLPEAP